MLILRLYRIPLLMVGISILLGSSRCFALTPDEVVVVANSSARDSVRLARYYMKQRTIPKENLIKVRTTWNETCTREDYRDNIAEPVREAIQKLKESKSIRSIVTMYGVPLKIRPPILDLDDKDEVKKLKQQIQTEQQKLKKAQKDEKSVLKNALDALKLQLQLIQQTDTRAAVDSELALVLTEDYPLENWLPSPYFLGFQNQQTFLKRDNVLIVARLDGPTPDIVRRVINDAIATEQGGLKGRAYFDARWKKPKEEKKLGGYTLYDGSLHKAADLLAKTSKLPVVLDDQNTLFQKNAAPDAALYCGWYSLAKYVDAFNWVQGAIGYHIASSECSTLKKENSQVWCKRMLEEGVTATIGPVYEPYVQAFPLPEIFFSKLTEGYLTLGEVYLISLPYLSWQMVLIGDPLYQPFAPLTDS